MKIGTRAFNSKPRGERRGQAWRRRLALLAALTLLANMSLPLIGAAAFAEPEAVQAPAPEGEAQAAAEAAGEAACDPSQPESPAQPEAPQPAETSDQPEAPQPAETSDQPETPAQQDAPAPVEAPAKPEVREYSLGGASEAMLGDALRGAGFSFSAAQVTGLEIESASARSLLSWERRGSDYALTVKGGFARLELTVRTDAGSAILVLKNGAPAPTVPSESEAPQEPEEPQESEPATPGVDAPEAEGADEDASDTDTPDTPADEEASETDTPDDADTPADEDTPDTADAPAAEDSPEAADADSESDGPQEEAAAAEIPAGEAVSADCFAGETDLADEPVARLSWSLLALMRDAALVEAAADPAGEPLPLDQWELEYDAALLDVAREGEDYRVTPIADFAETSLIVNNGSRYELTLQNGAAPLETLPVGVAEITPVGEALLPGHADGHAQVADAAAAEAAQQAVTEAPEAPAPAVDAEAVAADENLAATVSRTEYMVLDIALDNVDEAEYDGFDVVVTLPRDARLQGKDFQLYELTGDGAPAPVEGVKLESQANADGTETLSGLRFSADELNLFVISYTVDFEYNGAAFSMAAAGELLLSELFEALGMELSAADAVDAVFSDPELVAVSPVEGDWKLVSLQPFSSPETLTVTMADGAVVVIAVTDDQTTTSEAPQDITQFLKVVEVRERIQSDGGTIIGDSIGNSNSEEILVRTDAEYELYLVFQEDEEDPANGQFNNHNYMYYVLPDGVDFGDTQKTLPFLIDFKHGRTHGATVIYHPSGNTVEGANGKPCIVLQWDENGDYRELLEASPRTAVTLHFTSRITKLTDEVHFSDTIVCRFRPDDRYGAGITKVAEPVIDHVDGKDVPTDLVQYTVTVTATGGDAENLRIVDELVRDGVLSYVKAEEGNPRSGVRVEYANPSDAPTPEIPEGEETPPPNETLEEDEDGKGFTMTLQKLAKDQSVTLTYYAKFTDYQKLFDAGKSQYPALTRNTVKAVNGNRDVELNTAEAKLTNINNYLTLKKTPGTSSVPSDGGLQSIQWTVVYNDERHVDVEGSTLKDTIYSGSVDAMSYDFSREFRVIATDSDGESTQILRGTWSELLGQFTVTESGVDEGNGSVEVQNASWSWTIPPKADHGLDPEKHYKYTITYWTLVDPSLDISHYVGNVVEEAKTGTTADGTVIFGVDEPTTLQVDKECLQSVDGYTQWKISFARPGFALSRAVIEDTLPYVTIGGRPHSDQLVYTDENATHFDAPQDDNIVAGHPIQIAGLGEGEEWRIPTATDSRFVLRFYKTYTDERQIEGLQGAGEGYDGTITVTYWTKDDAEWIDAVILGKLGEDKKAHVNKVRLVLNGQMAEHTAEAIPTHPGLFKSGRYAGDLHGGEASSGYDLPVIEYTLTLAGVEDSMFDADGKIRVVDTYDAHLRRLTADELAGLGFASANADKLRPLMPQYDAIDANVADDATGHTLTFTVDKADFPKNDQDSSKTAYSRKYELTYYLVVKDEATLKALARQTIVEGTSSNSTCAFTNRATWTVPDGKTFDTGEVSVDVDFKPIDKIVTYDSTTERASYTIVVNPDKLTMNGGTRYLMEDEYSQTLAIDFQDVVITLEPDTPAAREQIEYAFHGNVGSFWLPDETKVTITYSGWLVGNPGDQVTFTNKATVKGYTAETTKTETLSGDHSGTAASYCVRVFKYADNNFNHALKGAVFQLFEEGPNGKTPMTYGESANGTNTGINADLAALNLGAGNTPTPTPKNHRAGDCIYFMTDETGYAEIMLSQTRDGKALRLNKQYYLEEVVTPTETREDGRTLLYSKEDHPWLFTIAEQDDWKHYIYSDDSILTVSNTSSDIGLLLRKHFVDPSNAIQYAQQKNIEFEVVGENDGAVVYSKTFKYSDFKEMELLDVNVPGAAEDEKEYVLIVPKNDLKPGRYTVTEKNADIPNYTYTTTVQTQAITDGEEPHGGTEPTFEVEANNKVQVNMLFTNTYQEKPASLRIRKDWSDDELTKKLASKSVTFTLYADGQPYQPNGADLTVTLDGTEDEAWTATVENLPRYNPATGKPYVWSVAETSAAYRLSDSADTVNVSGDDVGEHFHIDVTTLKPTDAEDGDQPTQTDAPVQKGEAGWAVWMPETMPADGSPDGSVTFTNELNPLITVKIDKQWAPGHTPPEDHMVYVDLYRTTQEIPDLCTPEALAALAAQEGTEWVRLEILERDASTGQWAYENSLMEGIKQDGGALLEYHYFAIERSLAGYAPAYAVANENKVQTITITNTPIEEKGRLTVTKEVLGLSETDANAQGFQFTLWNSGKYLDRDGNLHKVTGEDNPYAHTIRNGAPVTFDNVPLGVYEIRELDSAPMANYTLATTIEAGGDKTKGKRAEVTVDAEHSGDNPATVKITNKYQVGLTEFNFGKAWINPQDPPENIRPMPWPANRALTVQIHRKKANGTPDDAFVLTYSIAPDKGALKATPGEPFDPVEPVDDVVQLTCNGADAYGFYTFTLEGVAKSPIGENDAWVYYATETSSGDGDGKGRFERLYGYRDGITVEPTDVYTSAAEGKYLVNRLNFDQRFVIPISKQLTGRAIKATDSFTFQLYQDGQKVQDDQGRDVTVTVSAIQNPEGEGYVFTAPQFDVTDLMNLNETLEYDKAKRTFHGEYHFSVKEVVPETKILGVTYDSHEAKVDFDVTYVWDTDTLTIAEKIDRQSAELNSAAAFTNAYDPGSVRITKVWDDDNNRDGRRRDVTFTVTGAKVGDQDVTSVKKSDGTEINPMGQTASTQGATGSSAAQTVVDTGLPKYLDSERIDYTFSETIGSPASSYYTLGTVTGGTEDGYTVTNTHEPATMSVSATKVWDNTNAPTGFQQPTSVTVRLLADGKPVQFSDGQSAQVTLNADTTPDPRAHTWTKLPVFKHGKVGRRIVYTVEELNVPLGYRCTVSPANSTPDPIPEPETSFGCDFTVTNTYVPAYVTVSKAWDDENDRDGLRDRYGVDFVDVALTAKDSGGSNVTLAAPFTSEALNRRLSASDTPEWTASWKKLPGYYHNAPVNYSVTEDLATALYGEEGEKKSLGTGANGLGYTSEVTVTPVSGQDGHFTVNVKNSRNTEKVSVVLTKTWDDGGDQDGIRPVAGTAAVSGKQLYASFVKLKKVTAVSDQGEKTWSDVSASDYALTVAPPTEGSDEIKKNTYIVTFSNLPKYESGQVGQLIEYAVEEITTGSVIGATEADGRPYYVLSPVTQQGDDGYHFTATNKHEVARVSVQVTKQWQDENNRHGQRPASVAVKLVAKKPDGSAFTLPADDSYSTANKTLSGDTWTDTWNNLPKYAPGLNGVELSYSVEEVDAPSYYTATRGAPSGPDANGLITQTITNAYRVSAQTTLYGVKSLSGRDWADNDTFTFTLTGEDTTPDLADSARKAAPMPTVKQASVGKDTEDHRFSFGPMAFDQTDIGHTYTYTLTESEVDSGLHLTPNPASRQKTVTVTVSYNATTHGLTITHSADADHPVTFENTYADSITATLYGSKALLGRAWANNDEFTFTLAGEDVTSATGITRKDSAPMPSTAQSTATVTSASDSNFTLGPIPFDQTDIGHTYRYTVTESAVTNITRSPASYTVDLTVGYDAANHALTVTRAPGVTGGPTGTEQDRLTFENTYTANAETTLYGVKTLSGRDWADNDTFTFTLTGEDTTSGLEDSEKNEAPMPSATEATVRGSASNHRFSFGPMAFDQTDIGHTYTYTLTESELDSGLHLTPNPASRQKTVTVTVSYNATTHGLTITHSADADHPVTFENTYADSITATLYGSKALLGRAWANNDEFTFTLAGEDVTSATGITRKDSAPMPTEEAQRTATVTSAANSNFTLGPIPFDQTDIGHTYRYTVTESAVTNITCAPESYAVDLTVGYDAANHALTVTRAPGVTGDPTGTEQDRLAFENTYAAEAETTLYGVKTLSGRDWADNDTFTFTLTGEDTTPGLADSEKNEAPMPSATEATVDKDAEDHGFSFGPMAFNQTDIGHTYTYTLTETERMLNVEPKEPAIEVQVTVTYDATTRGLKITHGDDRADADHPVTFENTYTARAEMALEGVKQIENRDFAEGDAWTFAVSGTDVTEDEDARKADDDVPLPKDGAGERVTEVTLQPDSETTADFGFGAIPFDQTDIGHTYQYTVTETGDIPGVTNDPDAESGKVVQVAVAYDPDSKGLKLTASMDGEPITGADDERLTFVNTYAATGEITLGGVKRIENRDFKPGDSVTFAVAAASENPDAPLPEPAEVTLEPAKGDSVEYAFAPIAYDLADAGGSLNSKTYYYDVTESACAMDGVTGDERVYRVAVTVRDVGNGALEVTASALADGEPLADDADDERPDNRRLDFVNVYAATGEITLGGVKRIENRDFKPGDSATLTIEAASVNPDAPLPKDRSVTLRPAKGDSADFAFAPIQYALADAGGAYGSASYVYRVAETTYSMDGVTGDGRAYRVTVNVADDGTGALKITHRVALEGGGSADLIEFKNVYRAAGKLSLTGVKRLENRAFAAGDSWTFTVTGDRGAPMPERTQLTIQPTAGNSAELDFGSIAYTTQDIGREYTYTVTETGSVANVANDGAKRVKVRVADNGDGTLAITSSLDQTPLTFVNTYREPKPTATATTKPTATATPKPTATPEPMREISGSKIWVDEGDAHHTRPERIRVSLYADGRLVSDAPDWTVAESNLWTYTFGQRPALNANGEAIEYTVRETPVSGYSGAVNGLTITNTLLRRNPAAYVDLAGEKTWNDDNDAGGARPDRVTVTLLRDGEPVATRTVTAADGWQYSFGSLPADDGYGNAYTYTLREEPVQGYAALIRGMDVTNIRLPGDDVGALLAKVRGTGTPGPDFTRFNDEQLEQLLSLLYYDTPLWGRLLPTGDSTPVYPFAFAGAGALALAAWALLGRRRRRGGEK